MPKSQAPRAHSAGPGLAFGNKQEPGPPAADGSSPAWARNIKLLGTGHGGQLKFLLLPREEPRQEPGPQAENHGAQGQDNMEGPHGRAGLAARA